MLVGTVLGDDDVVDEGQAREPDLLGDPRTLGESCGGSSGASRIGSQYSTPATVGGQRASAREALPHLGEEGVRIVAFAATVAASRSVA